MIILYSPYKHNKNLDKRRNSKIDEKYKSIGFTSNILYSYFGFVFYTYRLSIEL